MPAPGPARSPSAIPTDELTPVYEGLVHWADVVLIATPIRWGNASSLYFKMAERLNCIQNQITIHNRRLIHNKVAALIITGGQDNIQAVAGGMLDVLVASSASSSPRSRSSPTRAAGTRRTCRTTSRAGREIAAAPRGRGRARRARARARGACLGPPSRRDGGADGARRAESEPVAPEPEAETEAAP